MTTKSQKFKQLRGGNGKGDLILENMSDYELINILSVLRDDKDYDTLSKLARVSKRYKNIVGPMLEQLKSQRMYIVIGVDDIVPTVLRIVELGTLIELSHKLSETVENLEKKHFHSRIDGGVRLTVIEWKPWLKLNDNVMDSKTVMDNGLHGKYIIEMTDRFEEDRYYVEFNNHDEMIEYVNEQLENDRSISAYNVFEITENNTIKSILSK